MKKRNISITLDTAKEWYNSNNNILKEIALTAFSIEELELKYSTILKKVELDTCHFHTCKKDMNKFFILHKLSILAAYFNKGWEKTISNEPGYFLAQKPILNSLSISIFKHETVVYPGIIYFKNREDLETSIKLLGDNIDYLFKI